jgi:hypothetical protein
MVERNRETILPSDMGNPGKGGQEGDQVSFWK